MYNKLFYRITHFDICTHSIEDGKELFALENKCVDTIQASDTLEFILQLPEYGLKNRYISKIEKLWLPTK